MKSKRVGHTLQSPPALTHAQREHLAELAALADAGWLVRAITPRLANGEERGQAARKGGLIGRPSGECRMKSVRSGALIGLGLLSCLAATSAAAQVRREASELQRQNRAVLTAPAPHGSRTFGPGEHAFTVCNSGCDLSGDPSQPIAVTFEVLGCGGGGGAGKTDGVGGRGGGGGGGGGGYGRTTIQVWIPPNHQQSYLVTVGSWGVGMDIGSWTPTDGGATQVKSPLGDVVVRATGGKGGRSTLTGGGPGGAPGTGTGDSWSGTAGQAGGPAANCNGGPGGSGGAGGGPGRTGPGYVNDGGDGGAGGYLRYAPNCTSRQENWGLRPGLSGKGGKATIKW